jgi:hypothetical protein
VKPETVLTPFTPPFSSCGRWFWSLSPATARPKAAMATNVKSERIVKLGLRTAGRHFPPASRVAIALSAASFAADSLAA